MTELTFTEAKVNTDNDGRTWFAVNLDRDSEPVARRFVFEQAAKKPRPYTAELKEFRNKRSLDANAYYHVMVRSLAGALRITENRCHNLMLRRYGALEVIGGNLVYVFIPETETSDDKVLESETYHLKITSQTKYGKNGETFRAYLMLKGSRDYDTAEMSRLIDGLVDECKQMGVETLPPYKLDLMKREWG